MEIVKEEAIVCFKLLSQHLPGGNRENHERPGMFKSHTSC